MSVEQQAAAQDYLKRVADPLSGDRPIGRRPQGVDVVAAAQAAVDREIARAGLRAEASAAQRAAETAAGRKPKGPPTLMPAEQQAHVVRVVQNLSNARNRAARKAAKATQDASREMGISGTIRRNSTDPDSRMMHAAEQAVALINEHRADPNTHEGIGVVLADAGYLSNNNLTEPGPDRLIAVGNRRDLDTDVKARPATGAPPPQASPIQAMSHRLRTEEGRRRYKRRGVTVEPVNGHIKDHIGLRQFSRRGLPAAHSEIQLASAVANLLKLHRARPA